MVTGDDKCYNQSVMKQKKIFSILSALAMMLTVSGCAEQKVQDSGIKDGVYTGVGTGYGGNITADVTFKNQKISKIEITGENETETVSDSAVDNIPKYIKDNQSLKVDVSTGATQTSKGIIDAVGDAVEKAGGKKSRWMTDATGKHQDKVKKEETTAVVIGGGTSGCAAALRLEQLGVDTTVVEKSDELGGSMKNMTHATQIVSGSRKLEEQAEQNDEEMESVSDAVNDAYVYGDSGGDQTLLKVFADHLQNTVDWQLNDLGIRFSKDWTESTAYNGNAVKEYNSKDGPVGQILAQEVKVSGAEILKDTAVTAITYQDGKASGVKAKASDGTVYQISCDYIVISSGSSAGKISLRNQSDEKLPYGGIRENEGDLQVIGNDLNYALTDKIKGAYDTLGFAFNDQEARSIRDANRSVAKLGFYMVNSSGKRFVNEEGSSQDMSDAADAQKDHTAYLVMNETAYGTWKKELLDDDSLTDEEKKALTDDALPGIFTGDNLAEAAQAAGVDPAALTATNESYNQMTGITERPDSYGREISGLGIDAEHKTVIIRTTRYLYQSLDGLKADKKLNVVLADGTPLTNVYVTGSAVGNVFGRKTSEGAANAWAFTSGRTAGDEIFTKVQTSDNK